MALRMKTRWHKDKSRSQQEVASAIAFIIWRIGMEALLELENEGFLTYSNDHRLQVMGEFLAFLLQVTDRLSHEDKMDNDDRQTFIISVAKNLVRTFAENKAELSGAGDHAQPLVDLFNQRADEYADLSFAGGEAKVDFLRHFGECLQQTMDGEKDKYWIVQRAIESDGPESIKQLKKALNALGD